MPTMQMTYIAVVLNLFFISSKVSGNLYQLCEQLDYYGNLSPLLDCLEYNNYGCWCGFGGEGNPVDPIDECCRTHDGCYDKVQATHSRFCLPWLVVYKYAKGNCLTQGDSCAAETCKCDNTLAHCVIGKKYHMQYKFQRIKGKCRNNTMLDNRTIRRFR